MPKITPEEAAERLREIEASFRLEHLTLDEETRQDILRMLQDEISEDQAIARVLERHGVTPPKA